jgi:sugar-specific transcriptional regulator TrmB
MLGYIYMEQELMSLGLTWNEVKVYMSLMKLGGTQVGGIINDLKVHRQIAYNALDALEKRGMVQKTMKNGIAHFKINDPDVIVEEARKREMTAARLSESIKLEMKKSRHEHEINIYNGQEGVKKFYIQAFKKFPIGDTVYIMGVSVKGHENALGEEFIKGTYRKLRDQRKIYSKLVMGESERTDEEGYNRNTNPELRQTRYLPYESANPISTTIWPDRVTFMSTGKNIFLVDIINKEFRDSFMDYFNMLWKIAKE